MEDKKTAAANAIDPLPVDPSNTSHIGQPLEQDVAKIKEGLNAQSNKAEDRDDKDELSTQKVNAENYLKNPSPEDMGNAT